MERKPASFEEVRDEVIRATHQAEQENSPALSVSTEDEYRILLGRGIEYEASGGLKVYVPPLRISQLKMLSEVGSIYADSSISEVDRLTKILAILAKVLGADQNALEENLDKDDLENIVALLTFSVNHGREMFKKKFITAMEMAALRTIAARSRTSSST